MPKTNPPKKQKPNWKITTIQNTIKMYISTTKSNDKLEKQKHIQNIVNNHKLSRKNKQQHPTTTTTTTSTKWINNSIINNNQQQNPNRIRK